MASSIEITTSETILFSSTDVFFFTIKKNIQASYQDEILIWFENTGNYEPEYWKIERDFNCSDYTNQTSSFRVFAPTSNTDTISLAISLDQSATLPKFTSLKINCRITSSSDIVSTTIHYQSTYSQFSDFNEVYAVNPNYNMPHSPDGTKQLLRTNPKLTGNVKISVDSNQNVWLNTIDANIELSSNRFKKYKVSGDGSYPYDVRKLLDSGRVDSKTLFFINEQDDSSVKTTHSSQYKSFYWSGAEYLTSLLYDEEFSFFAPLWIDKSIPDFFVIFASPEVIYDNTKNSIDNFKESVINNSKIVKVYSLKLGTILGNYIRSIVNSNVYNTSPIKVNYEDIKTITYRGIDYKNGIYTEKNEIIEDLINEDNPISFFENKVIEGFERNGLICYNLLNLEFLFNNAEAYDYDINRYFGFYVNENELSKFTIDEKGFYDNYNWIPKTKVKVDNESSFEIYDKDGISIVADLSDAKIPSSELLNESEHIFYVKGKYNLYKIKDSEIIDTSGETFFTKPSGKLITSQNFLDIADITGFKDTKFIGKSEIKEDSGFPFDIKFNNYLRDSDSISIIYQKGDVQKEWKVLANSYLVNKSSTLEQEIVKEPIDINQVTYLSSVNTYSTFNIGKFVLPEIIDFSIGTYIFLDYNYTIIGSTIETNENVSLTSGLNYFTVSSISDLSLNQPIVGTGIPANSYITSINTLTNVVTINNNVTTTSSEDITFKASILLKGNQTSLIANGDTIIIKNLLNGEIFKVEIDGNDLTNASQNTIVPIISNSYSQDISDNPSNYGAKLTSTEYSDEAKVRRCEISDIEFDYDNTRTILYVKDSSKLVINNTTLSQNISINLNYSNDYIFNYFNPNGSVSEYLDSIIKAFNTFDYKKFTISKKDSGVLIRSEFEPDAVFKLKIDLRNNHTEISDILLNNIVSKGFEVGYDISTSSKIYKKIISQEFVIPKKRYAFTIPSEFAKNISGDEWIKSNNGNKQLNSSIIQETISYYYNTESSSTIELELLDAVPPELDKESNAVFYNLHKNSLGVMSFIPIVDFDTDFLDSDYAYLPSEELKIYYYRFLPNERLPINQVYRINCKVRNNPSNTNISLWAVLSDGTEIQVGLTKSTTTKNRVINLNTDTNFIVLHTIPVLYSEISSEDDISHFYYTVVDETVANSNTTYLQNAISYVNSTFSNIESPDLDQILLNQFDGFNGIYDFLDSNELNQIKEYKDNNQFERFSYALLRSEYDKLRENYNTNLFNKSRTLPYINKWVIKNSSDIRSNEYRFNVSLAFGDKGYSPDDLIETPSSIICHTHEWYYIEGIPSWYDASAVENDRVYTFSRVLDEDLLNSDYDGFSRCFVRGSHKEKYNGNYLNTNTRNLFTYITYDKLLNKAFVLFKGAKFELNVPNPSLYDNWRFTSVLRPKKRNPFTRGNNLDIQIIENKKWKTITMVLDAHLESYNFPERDINLLGLYTLESAKTLSLKDITYISYPIEQTFQFTNADLQLVGGLLPTFNNVSRVSNFIKINTTDDLSLQIKALQNGKFNDIRAFGWGNRDYNTTYDNKGVYLQFFGDNLNSANSNELIFALANSNDTIAYEFSAFSNPIPLPPPSDERAFNPPKHINYNYNISTNFRNNCSYYIKSGFNSLKDILRRLSFASILNTLEEKKYTHVIVDELGNITEYEKYNDFGLKHVKPNTILKKSLLQPYPDTEIPTEISINEVIGYSLTETDYDFQIVRYGGEFIPKMKEIVNFYPSESVSFIEEFTNCEKPNTRFLMRNETFGIISNLGFHKVSDKKILTLADTAYSSSYPLIDETGIDYKDFNVFSSTWDYNYYRTYSDKNSYDSLIPLTESSENKTFFGSKLVSTPDTLLIEDFSFSNFKDNSKDFWYEVVNGVIEIHLYPSNMILKSLSSDKLRTNIKNSIKKLRNDSLFNEDFFEGYILENLVKIYKIASIKLFVRGGRDAQDILLNTSDETRSSLGFTQDSGILIDNRTEDVLIKRNLTDLSNPQISLSILFDKI